MPTAALAGILAFAAVILGIYLFLTWQSSDGRSPLDILRGGRSELSDVEKLQVLGQLSAYAEAEQLSVAEKEEVMAELNASASGTALLPEEEKVRILESMQL